MADYFICDVNLSLKFFLPRWFGTGSFLGQVLRRSREPSGTAKHWHAMALWSSKFLEVHMLVF